MEKARMFYDILANKFDDRHNPFRTIEYKQITDLFVDFLMLEHLEALAKIKRLEEKYGNESKTSAD